MTYKEALDFLYSQLPMYQRVGGAAFKKDLSNSIQLCRALNNPESKFKSIHVAGTNGKGTTSHFLASILQEAGYKTGLYTSPHLKSFTERIKINGIDIKEAFIVDFVEKVKSEIKDIKPSFFEITVVMAFDYFAKQEVDIAVIETGLGGRLDSTNVILPELSIITNIALDHQDMLGNTLEEIAREKAGIIKRNVPIVIGLMPELASHEISAVAANLESRLNADFTKYSFEQSSIGFRVNKNNILVFSNLVSGIKGEYVSKILPHVLEGIAELRILGYKITDDHIQSGIEGVVCNTGLKGRWQTIDTKPLMICDIAHNEQGIEQVISQIEQIEYKKLHIVLGAVEDKTLNKILSLMPKNATYYFCAANIPRALHQNLLKTKAELFGLIGQTYNSVKSAIEQAQINASENDLIFIGGSTFVVAEIEDL